MTRDELVAAFHAAVADCDPARRVREGLRLDAVAALITGRRRFGVAIGKAALAMARGLGAVERGVIVVPASSAFDVADVPLGWRVVASAHPFVDERSVDAATAAREVIDAAGEGDVVFALISGGTSALIEEPIDGLTIEELGAKTRAAMESGLSIHELNDLRSTLSRVKRGGLVASCAAPVVTFAVSDVIGDGLAVIGSGPTIGPWFEDALPRIAGVACRGSAPRERDIAAVVGPMASFSGAARAALTTRAWLEETSRPLQGDVADCAKRLIGIVGGSDGMHGALVAWGEPTLRVPEDHGEGGRAQQLALELAKALRGTSLLAMVIGSDGVDGPPPQGRPAPAGAIVDGQTWDAIVATGHDPERALARCDAGTVLHAAGALVVTGPTGINHADLVVIGDRRGASDG